MLYAEGDDSVDTSGLELIAAVAGSVLESRSARARLVTLEATVSRDLTRGAGDWSALSGQERELHSRAQRFARVHVAEMRLYKSQAVKLGRARRRVYSELKPEIDAARETFQREFVQSSPSMVDYFHLELVRTLANDDVALLGGEYPGPLV